MKHGPFRAAAGPQCVRIEGALTRQRVAGVEGDRGRQSDGGSVPLYSYSNSFRRCPAY
jgi:hypothetical protein|eukprot:COSAG03_NODE_1997_length_3246_cov_78.542421_4_plen_58_part_00